MRHLGFFLWIFLFWALTVTMLFGCASDRDVVFEYQNRPPKMVSFARVQDCANSQWLEYNDVCAEADRCEEYDDQWCNDKAAQERESANLLIDNHFMGAFCAAEAIKACVLERQWATE